MPKFFPHRSRAAVAWFGLLVLAFVNGAVREIGMKKIMGLDDLPAHQLSCLTGAILWSAFALAVWRWLEVKSLAQSVRVGLGWLVATLLFETFVLNGKLTWAEIAHTYDVSSGELWGLALLWIGFLPILIYWIKNFRSEGASAS